MSIYLGNNLIAPNQSNAANKSLSNLDSTGQSILDNKADVSLSNVNNTAKILMSSMGMPSNKYIDLTLGANDSTYTAPANGYYIIGKGAVSGRKQYIDIYNQSTSYYVSMQISDGGKIRLCAPVRKGDTIRIWYNAAETTDYFRFIYAVGSESEAN